MAAFSGEPAARLAFDAQVMGIAAAAASEGDGDKLAVAASRLDGNDWTGLVAIVSAAPGETKGQLTCSATSIVPLASGANDTAFLRQGDKRLVAAALDGGDVELFTVTSRGLLTPTLSLSEHGGAVHGLSSSGSMLASAAADASIILWDMAAAIPHLPAATLRHSYGTVLLDVEFQPKDRAGNILAASSGFSSSAPSGVYVHDRRSSESPVSFLETNLSALCVNWDSAAPHLFRAGLEDGQVLTFDQRNLASPLHCKRRHKAAVRSLATAPTGAGTAFVSCGEDTRIICTFEDTGASATSTDFAASPSGDYVHAVQVVSVGSQQFIASGGYDGGVTFHPMHGAKHGKAGGSAPSAMVEG